MAINPRTIVERGKEIYATRYQRELEATALGQYVAIDVQTEEAHVRSAPGEALRAAREAHVGGYFYLIKIGSPGVFHLANSSKTSDGDWLFGQIWRTDARNRDCRSTRSGEDVLVPD